MITYKNVSIAATGLTFILFIILLFFPNLIFFIFNIEGAEAALLLSRRAAMLFLGLAVISFLGRDSAHSSLRQVVCLGMMAVMFGLALTGIFEFVRGYASFGILLAVVAEISFGAAYAVIWQKNR